MLGIILRGYALMIPTLGLYRFWQATWKRRFYWQNTVIDGEPLEYTGTRQPAARSASSSRWPSSCRSTSRCSTSRCRTSG